jgi:hypothetical protein
MLRELVASLSLALRSSSYDDTRAYCLLRRVMWSLRHARVCEETKQHIAELLPCNARTYRSSRETHAPTRVLTVPAQVPLSMMCYWPTPVDLAWVNNNSCMVTATAPSLHSLPPLNSPDRRHVPTSDQAQRESQCSRSEE